MTNRYLYTKYKKDTYMMSKYKTLEGIEWKLPKCISKHKGNSSILIGIDTETDKDGRIKLIADSNGRYWCVDKNKPEGLINWLWYKGYRGKWLVFWNLRYDFFALLKCLPQEIWEEIYINNFATYNEIELSYLPQKWFGMKKAKHKVNCYDVAQFYHCSLELATKKYLNPNIEELEKMSKFKKEREYLFQKFTFNEILEYCITDARYTQRLGEHIKTSFRNSFGIYMPKPYSPAYLAQSIVRVKCHIPLIKDIDKNILEYAYRCYYGGRFEIFKRGTFTNAYCYDINSAYPDAVKDIYNIQKGIWRKVTRLNEEATYGFYKVIVNNNEWKEQVGNLPFRTKTGQTLYPFDTWIGWYTKEDLSLVKDYEIINGYEFTVKYPHQPFNNYVTELYRLKTIAKEDDDKIKYLLYKLMLNSIYGKFAQTKGNKTGYLFNSVYASHITAKCRKQLYETCTNNKILSYATDSIITDKPLENIKLDNEIGGWKKEEEGTAIIIMSGMYKISDKIGERGLPKLWEEYKKDITKRVINIKMKRPLTVSEVYKNKLKYKLEDFNVFKEIERGCDINGDFKRLWANKFDSVEDMLSRNMGSEPIRLMYSA